MEGGDGEPKEAGPPVDAFRNAPGEGTPDRAYELGISKPKHPGAQMTWRLAQILITLYSHSKV